MFKFNFLTIFYLIISLNCRQLFWINFNSNQPTIEQSYLDGGTRETILSDELFRPTSLIIKGRYIYWMDRISKGSRRGFKLERFNIDSKKREIVCQSKNVTIEPFAMDISESLDSIYWSDWHNMAIWKLDLLSIAAQR